MAGKRRKHVVKRGKKKSSKKLKNLKKIDPKQTKLPFVATKPDTTSENILLLRSESTSSGISDTSDLHRKFTTASLSSCDRKRPHDSEQVGPEPKKPNLELSCRSLEDISEESNASCDENYMTDDDYEEESASTMEEEDDDEVEEISSLDEKEQSSSMDEDDSDYSEDDENRIENDLFEHYKTRLNEAAQLEAVTKPPQLDEALCKGVGDPSQVWNVMCKKDELEHVHALMKRVDSSVERQTRAVLVDWMMEVCEQEKQHRDTFHLSVAYLDRYLATLDKPMDLKHLQCLGTVALFMASKFEEIYPPKLDAFVEYTDGACTRQDLEMMEILVLNKINWSLSIMTSVHWLSTFFQLMGNNKVIPDDSHYEEKSPLMPKYLRDQFMNMAKVLDVAVMDTHHLKFSYRKLAAAVLFVGYEPHDLIEKVTGYSYNDMQPAIEWIRPCYQFSSLRQTVGDPLPSYPDISSDEWHIIQTHGDLNVEQGFKKVINMRMALEKKKNEAKERFQQLSKFKTTRKLLRPANESTVV